MCDRIDVCREVVLSNVTVECFAAHKKTMEKDGKRGRNYRERVCVDARQEKKGGMTWASPRQLSKTIWRRSYNEERGQTDARREKKRGMTWTSPRQLSKTIWRRSYNEGRGQTDVPRSPCAAARALGHATPPKGNVSNDPGAPER